MLQETMYRVITGFFQDLANGANRIITVNCTYNSQVFTIDWNEVELSIDQQDELRLSLFDSAPDLAHKVEYNAAPSVIRMVLTTTAPKLEDGLVELANRLGDVTYAPMEYHK